MNDNIKAMELDDGALDGVSGGFMETNKSLVSYGYNIACPFCGTEKAADFATGVLANSKEETVQYRCNKCGRDFIVYKRNGQLYAGEANAVRASARSGGINI